MNGPEHYREAERLLAIADQRPSENWPTATGEYKADRLALAQVHATLALAAASALPHGWPKGSADAWAQAVAS